MENQPMAQGTPEPSATTTAGSHARRWVVILLLVAVAAIVVWRVHSNNKDAADAAAKQNAAANRATPVLVAAAQQRTMPIYVTALGTVVAYNTVTVKSRVDGQLVSVNVREGQHVAKGQLLAQIDAAPYEAAVKQAEGQYAKDQATVVNNKAEAARYEALYKAGVVSRESEEAQIAALGQAAGSLDADKAAIQAAKVNLAYTKIASPIDGVVGLRQVDPGNIVHASDTTGLIVVTQLQPIAVVFTLPEDQLPQVQQKLATGAVLVAEAYDRSETTKLATGKLLTVDNQIDPTTGMVKLKAVFDNQDGALFPNQFVNIRLILEERPNVVTTPAAAEQTGSAGNFVYVAGKNAAGDTVVNVRPIVTTVTEGATMLIDSGLSAGELVVVDGQEKLRDGSKVAPTQQQHTNVAPSGTGASTQGKGQKPAGAAQHP